MSVHEAWGLLCRMFVHGAPILRATLAPRELAACALLGAAIKPAAINHQYVLCPYCNLHQGEVFGDGHGGKHCRCPACGLIPLSPQDIDALVLNEDWLRQKLRMALEINSRDGIDQVGQDLWRLGESRRAPVILSRNLNNLLRNPGLLESFRVRDAGLRVITSRPLGQTTHPFAQDIEWLVLEERFAFYGGAISFIEPAGPRAAESANASADAFYGPFTVDFRSVVLSEYGHVNLTEGQAAVFTALWSFKGEPMRAERIMAKAGLKSEKPIDVFKVKTRDKDKPGVDLPMKAYKELVSTQRREGLYAMSCALGQ
jgi:hypothetical protein